jgi:transposase
LHCQACSSSRDDAIRELVLEQGVWANIAPKRIRKRTFAFSGWARQQRNLVERLLSRPKQFKGIATRYDKDSGKGLAAIKLASARIRCARMHALPSLEIGHQIGSGPLPRADPLSSDKREVG